MTRTRVKICGITRPEDALAAAEAGADAIGLIQQREARRYVSLDRARAILKSLPPLITPVAVFVNQPAAEIREMASALGIGQVQLHGNEPPSVVAELFPLRAIKAIRVTPDLPRELARWEGSSVLGFVFDTASAQAAGGTGETNDWGLIKQAQADGLIAKRQILTLAGGLTPENVGEAVRSIRPWAVDVSSGVESSPGIKSVEKLRAFIDAVRDVDRETAGETDRQADRT